MSGANVTYLTSLPTQGMSLVVLNTNQVVLQISSDWTNGKDSSEDDFVSHYDEFVAAANKSILVSCLTNSKPLHVLGNDEDCTEDDVINGGLMISDFVVSNLDAGKEHEFRISIQYGGEDAFNYKISRTVFGAMDAPVVKSAELTAADYQTAIVTVWPHYNADDANKLRTADIKTVIITAMSEKDTFTKKYSTISDDGKYAYPGLSVGETYRFFVEMVNKTDNRAVSAPEFDGSVSLYIVDATAFDVQYLSAPADKDVLTVTIAPFSVADITNKTDADSIEKHRPLFITLLTATVPANRLDAATYVPSEKEWASNTYNFEPYDSKLKTKSFAGSKLQFPNMNGLTMKYKAAITNGNGQSSYCTLQTKRVEPISIIDAGALAVQGLQLIGHKYTVVSDDKKSDLSGIGEWSCDGELIIGGSTSGSSITLSAFDGISSNGVNIKPTVALRTPVIKFVHDKESSPFYRIKKCAVYAKVIDFAWTDFTAKDVKFKRADLALDGANLEIAGKQWLAVASASIDGGLTHSNVEVAVCELDACDAPSYTISLAADGESAVVTFTVTEVATHADFVEDDKFTDLEPGVLNYIIINNTTGVETLVSRDQDGDLVDCVLPVVRGSSKNYFSIVARAYKSGILIGESDILDMDNLPIIPGKGRDLSGEYTCDAGAIASGVLAHAAGVGASFAFKYDGRFSVDQKVPDFANDTDYVMDYKMSNVESYDAVTKKWSAAAGAVVTPVSPLDADNKAIPNYACFRITGVIGLKKHRVKLAYQYKHKTNSLVTIPDQILQTIPFIPTVLPVTPTVTYIGSEGQVNVIFANGSSAESQAVQDCELRNDLLLQGSDGKTMTVVKSSSEPEFTYTGLSGLVAVLSGARSYAGLNADYGSLLLVDDDRVSSVATGPVSVNIDKGPAKLTGVSAATVYTPEVKADATVTPNVAFAAEYYRTVFMCDAPADGVSVEVAVYYDAQGVTDDRHTVYPLSKDEKTGKFSAAVDPALLQNTLGLSADKFLSSNLKCVFTSSKEYSQTAGKLDIRSSQPVTVNYTPNKKPTLASAQFAVEKLSGGLRVTTGSLTSEHLGGNATLNVKIVATAGTVSNGQFTASPSKLVYSESNILSSSALSHTLGNMAAGLYQLSVVIQSGAFVGELALIIGTYTPVAALAASKTFTVVAASKDSLTASWTNLSSDELLGWALSSRSIFVSSIDAGVTTYYTAVSSVISTKTAYKSSSLLQETLSNLPTGKILIVSLETTYTKAGETPQVQHVDTQVPCAAAPAFANLAYDPVSGLVTALVSQNGSFLTNFWLFAKYANGVQGQQFFNVPIDNLNLKSHNNTNCQFKITLSSKPTAIMGILVNNYGAIVNGSPAATFGAPAGGSVGYNNQTDDLITINL